MATQIIIDVEKDSQADEVLAALFCGISAFAEEEGNLLDFPMDINVVNETT